MFFVISKLLFFLVQPLNWIVGLLLSGRFLKKNKWKKYCTVAGLLLLVLLTNPLLINLFMNGWEYPETKQPQLQKPFEAGILLGGYSNFKTIAKEQVTFNFHGNRLITAYQLYKRGIIKKIILSGGSGNLLNEEASEAAAIKPYLISLGVPDSDIIVEEKSRNTRENAIFSKKKLDAFPENSKYLLITSAFHMKRAYACFRKANIAVTPYPTGYLSEKLTWAPESIFVPDEMAIYKWQILIKEWIGYLAYMIQGYV